MIATLDDVIEEICDVAGIYGAHDDDDEHACEGSLKKCCRVCAASYLRTVIESAIEVERKLYGPLSQTGSEEKGK